MNDILLPLNGTLLLVVAWLYGSNIQYEGNHTIRTFVTTQSITAFILGVVNLAAGMGLTTTSEWIWLSRPTLTFFLVALVSLAFITRDSRRNGNHD